MLKPKFKVGQRVFAVSRDYDSKRVHVECDVCNSTGRVEINGRDGEYVCPVCQGKTETKNYGYKYFIAYYDAIIGKVSIEEYAKQYLDRNKSSITYMLDKTGVGSGSIWKEERLFATEDEAREFCEKYVPSDYYDKEAILKH